MYLVLGSSFLPFLTRSLNIYKSVFFFLTEYSCEKKFDIKSSSKILGALWISSGGQIPFELPEFFGIYFWEAIKRSQEIVINVSEKEAMGQTKMPRASIFLLLLFGHQTDDLNMNFFFSTQAQELLARYSSTVFAFDTSGDTRYIRCDFPQCKQHAEALQGIVLRLTCLHIVHRSSWVLNTSKQVWGDEREMLGMLHYKYKLKFL